MSEAPNGEPPGQVSLTLDEALALLADLEDASDGLIRSGYLTIVVVVEAQIDLIARKLGLGPHEGGSR